MRNHRGRGVELERRASDLHARLEDLARDTGDYSIVDSFVELEEIVVEDYSLQANPFSFDRILGPQDVMIRNGLIALIASMPAKTPLSRNASDILKEYDSWKFDLETNLIAIAWSVI